MPIVEVRTAQGQIFGSANPQEVADYIVEGGEILNPATAAPFQLVNQGGPMSDPAAVFVVMNGSWIPLTQYVGYNTFAPLAPEGFPIPFFPPPLPPLDPAEIFDTLTPAPPIAPDNPPPYPPPVVIPSGPRNDPLAILPVQRWTITLPAVDEETGETGQLVTTTPLPARVVVEGRGRYVYSEDELQHALESGGYIEELPGASDQVFIETTPPAEEFPLVKYGALAALGLLFLTRRRKA